MEVNHVLQKVQDRKPGMMDKSLYTRFAVLLPLIEKEDGLHILFEVRALNMRRQPGDICFPGGKVDDEDEDEQYTALRETSEELGIPFHNVHHVTPLDYLVNPTGIIIYPFLGVIDEPHIINPNESEVAEVFTVPVEYFLKVKPKLFKVHFKAVPEGDFPFNLLIGGENYQWQTRKIDEHFYQYKDKVIWGLTARILTHFINLIK